MLRYTVLKIKENAGGGKQRGKHKGGELVSGLAESERVCELGVRGWQGLERDAQMIS